MILFITANDNERIAFLAKLENQVTKTFLDGIVCKFGDFGRHKVAHYHLLEQGNGAELGIARAIRAISPKMIVLVGVACGRDSEKQKIGDVLISHRVIDYDCRKEDYDLKTNEEVQQLRGIITPSGIVLYGLFHGHCFDWQAQNQTIAHCGDIISSSALLNNPILKSKIFSNFHEAIGYEMECIGAFRACHCAQITEWILVKGVCDFGDGNKFNNKQENQKIAANNAVSLCHYAFSQDETSTFDTAAVNNGEKEFGAVEATTQIICDNNIINNGHIGKQINIGRLENLTI